jgi:1-deoxy-D-xylulose-5-phosphate synthase
MIDATKFPLLSQIDNPQDLKKLAHDDLVKLAAEVRSFMIESLDHCGGHFGSNLGTVELAIALHYLYDTPHDNIVWDVGHQAYPHKILTGRKEELKTIRQIGGLAPFPNREESEYDVFGVGHSSTSIGAALGMSLAASLQGIQQKNIAIIGDGAMTAGMAFEALNHAGGIKANLLVILNDNDMSISNNVGALNNYFARMWSSDLYTSFREGSKRVLEKMPPSWGELMRRTEEHMKGMVAPGTLFEEMGFYYVGPIDGHDLPLLLNILEKLKKQSGPRLLHIVTKKGKGYEAAEAEPIEYHAVKPKFNSSEKCAQPVVTTLPTYSAIFGQWLCDIAEQDTRVVGITPAMCEGSDLIEFSQKFPERYFDVGIAEQHAVTLAAGMACAGLKPIVAIYSTFLQRAYDQFIHDVALQNLPVVFALDRAGLVGGDGATHNGAFDLSFARCIPNVIIMAPADENELRQMLYTAYLQNSPTIVRYPRGTGPGITVQKEMTALPLGVAQWRRQGKKIALLAFGSMLLPCETVAHNIDATLINMRFVKPLDEALLKELIKTHEIFVTVEENAALGGAGSAVNEMMMKLNAELHILNLGLPDKFIEHGNHQQLLAQNGLDANGIEQTIRNFIATLEEQAS